MAAIGLAVSHHFLLMGTGGKGSGGGIPPNVLLAEDNTPLMTEDGQYILIE